MGWTTVAPLRVAVFVDLERTTEAGGHVKFWERMATVAAADPTCGLDLTVYFSGTNQTEVLAPHVRFRTLPPVLSTARLRFLPHVPAHTDLAPWHSRLAQDINAQRFDVLHTTDGYFAFSRTAARMARLLKKPLTTSFHTDTPNYTRLFTRQFLTTWFARLPRIRRFLDETLQFPERQGRAMERRMEKHLRRCVGVLTKRDEEAAWAQRIVPTARIKPMRGAVNTLLFNPHARDRHGILAHYGIPDDRTLVLFAGRLDYGKNINVLIGALQELIERGLPIHLIAAGTGPAGDDIVSALGTHATLAGFVTAPALARLAASVDVIASPSEVESRSNVVLEALACGTPVLVAEVTKAWDLCGHTDAIMPVSSGIEAWRNALHVMATDTQRHIHMRQVARTSGKTIVADWQDVLREDFLALWREVAGK